MFYYPKWPVVASLISEAYLALLVWEPGLRQGWVPDWAFLAIAISAGVSLVIVLVGTFDKKA